MPQSIRPVPTRLESDSMGAVAVPTNVYWRAETARSLTHFSIGHDRMPMELIWAFGILKKAAALVHEALGKLPPAKARLIRQPHKGGNEVASLGEVKRCKSTDGSGWSSS